MEFQIATLRLITSKTAISMLQVYVFDTTISNAIGISYICINFVRGNGLVQYCIPIFGGSVPKILTAFVLYLA